MGVDFPTAVDVPSVAWSPGSSALGSSVCSPLHLSGSPSVPLPAAFLTEMDLELAGRRVSASGRPELREAIAEHIEKSSGGRYDPEREILVTNGAIQALDLVFRALVRPGATVGLVCPTFFVDRLIPHAGLIHFNTTREDSWRPTPSLIEEIRRAELDVLFLVNPNNPTGVVYTMEELQEIVRATAASETLLIVDEAYEAFVYDSGVHTSLHAIVGARNRVVSIQSFTKSFGLGAARLGFVFGPADRIDPVRRLLGWVTLASNPLSQALALAAMRAASWWRPLLRVEFETNRSVLADLIATGRLPGRTVIPQGATFSLLDIALLGMDSRKAARQLWHSTGIACVPGAEFPGDVQTTDAYLRLPLGAPPAIFEEAMLRLTNFLDS